MANYFLNDDGSLSKKKKKKKGNNYIIQDDGKITLNPSDIAPVKKTNKNTITTNKIDGDYSTYSRSDLQKEVSTLQKQISSYGDDDDKISLKEFWNAFTGKTAEKNKKDKNYKALTEKYKTARKTLEDKTVEETKYKDGLVGHIEKSTDVILGNTETAKKGIETTISKVLGKTPTEEQIAPTLAERQSAKALQSSKGTEKVILDVTGSVARMMPQMMVGNPVGAVAMGFANYGGGAYNQARQDGYSDEKATIYGATIGGMEMALTQVLGSFSKIYGIRQLGKASQGVIDKFIPKVIANKQVRQVLTQFGSEGIEEFLQEYIDGIAKDTLLDDKGLKKSIADNITDTDKLSDALYSAFVGGLTGSAMATPTAIDSYKFEKATGRDYETGLTKNEQTVLTSEVNKRTTEVQKEKALNEAIQKEVKDFESTFGTMSEAEKKGITERIKNQLEAGEIDFSTSKLSKKEIKAIEEQVRSDLKKGNIEVETIEDTLLGEKTAQIKELQQKLDKTTNEQEKAQIQAEINELQRTKAEQMKSMLGQDAYLQKSYGEAIKKGQKFHYEVTGYESEYKKSLAKDFEKVANDTTKSHELFETLSKVAEDKQTNYGVINNAQLKQLGYDVEGKDVNGLVRVNKDGTQKVLINVDSSKAINRIVGHETTHLLEGTKEYTELQEMVKEYAETKGDYNRLHKELTKLYDGLDADIEAEVTAELVGDYLFTDETFVNNLSTQKPTIFQKIYNEIKHLYKLATAGSKEARQLEKVKKAFDKAYKENASNTQENENIDSKEVKVKYAISEKGTLRDSEGNDVKLETSEIGTHGTLMAIHNLSGSKLKGILELGGFPVPSIAVMNPSTTDLSYGEISVLFDKSTIDPSNKANEVYGSDVYSPRFPQTVQKVNEKELSKLQKYLGKNIYVEDTTLEETKQKMKYEKAFIDKFIEENNIKVEDVYKDADDNYGFSKDEAMKQFVIENDINYEKLLTDSELRSKFYDTYRDFSPMKGLAERKIETWEKIFEQGTLENSTASRLNADFNAIKNGSEKVLDQYSTDLAKRTKVLEDYSEQYNKYLDEKLTPIFEQKYIRNSKELFTPSGNRRSFNQLYNEYTLDNVVKEMKGKVRGEEGFFYGSGNIRSQVTPQFKSIADIKANESKLVTNSQMESVKQDIDSDLNNLSVTAKNFGGYSYDSYETALNEIAGLKKITPTKVKEILSDYGFENVPDILVDKSIEFLEKLKNAPTEYFEAKPQRAVGLDEVQAIVMPNNTDASLKQQLMDNGLNVVEYDPNIEGDKQSKINQFDDLKFSLSNQNETIAPVRGDVFGSDIKLQVEEAIAPLKEAITEIKEAIDPEYESTVDYSALTEEDLPMWEQQNEESFRNIDESNIPIEQENTTPDIDDEVVTPAKSLEEVRDFDEVGSRKVKAYQYEHPEVRPYFQEMARYMLGDLESSVKGERSFNDQLYYDTNGEQGFYGTTRQTTDDIAELLDSKYKYTYKDIRKGLEAIIEDNGAENIAIAKRIELALDKRLREGYTDVSGYEIPANEGYIKLLREIEFSDYYDSIPIDESMIPAEETTEDIAPVVNASNKEVTEKVVPIKEQLKENSVVEEKPSRVEQQTAQILDEKPTPKNKDRKLKAIATVNLIDKGYYISKLARETNNRQLDALWDNTLLSNAQAQEVIGEGRFKFNEDTKTYEKVGNSVYEIFEGLETTNKVKDFNEYMYHKLNIERMSLEGNAQNRMKTLKETILKDFTNEDINAMTKLQLREDAKQETINVVNAAKEYKSLSKVKNKPVFGFTIDADTSIEIVNRIEQNNPEFSDYAKKVYDYESGTYSDLSLLVESGILSQEDANYYRNKYESYVPILRDVEAEMMEKQMFGKRASVGNAVKSATGGNQNIIPLKDAMAIKTMLVQRSANMNKLGLELMYALNPVVESETVSAENIIEDISNNKDLIQAGTNGKAPTMTVYEHGVKKTFEIPQEIYEALKPNYDSNSKITIKPLNAFSNFKRNVLTQYNPFFMVTNMIKDAQDVLINSQHPASTYKVIPEAIAQLSSKGYWYKEMQSQGLFQDTYYDNQGGFDTAPKGISKVGEFYPLKKIAQINDFIERVPRMAEYIASRKAGRSVEVASLDASRVTTNFKAGGDWTKFFNRNGATFLNASIQGALQQVRNVQEAHQQGLKGYMGLATKFTVAALPAILLNNLLWDDDDEYEELSDYIKDNYYIIGKFGDGQFIRIPKGRMTAVIQKTIEQMQNLITGDDEVDLGSYLELVLNNIAPSNPIENNIFSPFINTKLFNKDDPGKTWYGGDLVPTRLQSKPAKEQYDETTDEFSKWLGEKLNLSPIKINNLIDQNTGVIGDLLLPMMTAEAKTKNDNPIAAGVEDKFTADVVFDNKYSTDFYSVKDDLAKKSNSYEATDKDILKTKYMNSKQAEMNDIYAEIRDVQNSDLDKKTKYAKVRDLRKQLNDIAENSLNSYNKVNIESSYAKVGEIEFRKNDSGEWQKITSKQLEKQNEAINNFGVSANNYWENKEEYDYAIENPDKYNAISQIDAYDNYIKYKDDIANIKEQYEGYSTKQRKAAVQEYIESLSLNIPQKIMLEKLAGGYSIKDYENYMYGYIESLPMSAAEKQKLHNELFN